MDWNILLVPGVALGRAVLGWVENAFEDGKIDLPEWKQLGATVIRMGVPMVALIWGLNVELLPAAAIITIFDIALTKIYNAVKKKK